MKKIKKIWMQWQEEGDCFPSGVFFPVSENTRKEDIEAGAAELSRLIPLCSGEDFPGYEIQCYGDDIVLECAEGAVFRAHACNWQAMKAMHEAGAGMDIRLYAKECNQIFCFGSRPPRDLCVVIPADGLAHAETWPDGGGEPELFWGPDDFGNVADFFDDLSTARIPIPWERVTVYPY